MKKQFGSYIVEGWGLFFLLVFDLILKMFFFIGTFFAGRREKKLVDEETESVRKILIIEIMGLGDAVLSTSMVLPLRKHFHRAKVYFLGNPLYISAVSGSYDRCIPLKAPWVRKKSILQWFSKDWIGFLRGVRELRKLNFDVSVDARCDFRSAFLSYMVGARHRLGFDFGVGGYFFTEAVEYGDVVHRSEEYCKILRYLGISRKDCQPYLPVDARSSEPVIRRLERIEAREGEFYLIHPGAARRYKKYPIENLSRIVDAIYSERPDLKPVVFGGSDDVEDIEALKRQTQGTVRSVECSVGELPALIGCCRFIICNNSGVMHIAAALGKRVVTFIGPTDRRIWSPLGDGHLVFQESEGLPCYPCGEEECVRPDNPCIRLIDVERVIEAILKSKVLD